MSMPSSQRPPGTYRVGFMAHCNERCTNGETCGVSVRGCGNGLANDFRLVLDDLEEDSRNKALLCIECCQE